MNVNIVFNIYLKLNVQSLLSLFIRTCDTSAPLEGGVHLWAAARRWTGSESFLLLFPDPPPSLPCAEEVSPSSSSSRPAARRHRVYSTARPTASSDQTPCVKGLCLTVCSRVSTWLSCSSHTPDSVWTLLTTLWSRSNLQRKRWRSKVNKHFRQSRLPDFLPVELASFFTASDVIISSRNRLLTAKLNQSTWRLKVRINTHSVLWRNKYFSSYPWCMKAMTELSLPAEEETIFSQTLHRTFCKFWKKKQNPKATPCQSCDKNKHKILNGQMIVRMLDLATAAVVMCLP